MVDRAALTGEHLSAAIDELRQLIRERYPEARFDVSAGPEPGDVYLIASVDVDDPDDVMDVYIERLVELQVEDRLPVYVMSLCSDDVTIPFFPVHSLNRAPQT